MWWYVPNYCSAFLLQQLLLILSDSVGVASLLAPPYDSTPVNYNMVLDWIVLLLDVHFMRITLDHQCRQSLLALQSKILAQVSDSLHNNSFAIGGFAGNMLQQTFMCFIV